MPSEPRSRPPVLQMSGRPKPANVTLDQWNKHLLLLQQWTRLQDHSSITDSTERGCMLAQWWVSPTQFLRVSGVCLADFLKKFIAYMTLSTSVTWLHTAVSVKYYSPGFCIICKFLDEPELIFSCICFKMWLATWSLLLTLHSPVMLA